MTFTNNNPRGSDFAMLDAGAARASPLRGARNNNLVDTSNGADIDIEANQGRAHEMLGLTAAGGPDLDRDHHQAGVNGGAGQPRDPEVQDLFGSPSKRSRPLGPKTFLKAAKRICRRSTGCLVETTSKLCGLAKGQAKKVTSHSLESTCVAIGLVGAKYLFRGDMPVQISICGILGTQVANIVSNDRVHGRLSSLEHRMTALESSVSDLDNKFTKRFDKLESRFDKLESRFDKLESRFDTLEASIKTLCATIEKQNAA